MSYQEQLAQMALNVLRDTGEVIIYTPQGGVARTFYAVRMPTIDAEFYGGTETFDYNATEMHVYSGDNTNGVALPKVTGRDGGIGDTLVFNSGAPAGTWYVKKLLQDGRGNGNLHRLLIANVPGALVDG